MREGARVIGLDLAGTGPSYLMIAGTLWATGWETQAWVTAAMAGAAIMIGLKIVRDAKARAARAIRAQISRDIGWTNPTLMGFYLAPAGAIAVGEPWEAVTWCATIWGSVLIARGVLGTQAALPSPLMWMLGYRARAIVMESAWALGVVYARESARPTTWSGQKVGGTTWIEEGREKAPANETGKVCEATG